MRCSKAQRLISAALDDELDKTRGAALEEHLEACRGCRDFAAELGGLGDVLDSLSAPDPRWGFSDRVLARLAHAEVAGERPVGWHQWLRPVPIAAALGAFFAGMTLVMLANGQAYPEQQQQGDPIVLLADAWLGVETQPALADELANLLPPSED
jgi:anti-sigma factor RsiW